jgi:hypothetical protein
VTARELLQIINNGNDLSEPDYEKLVTLHHEYPYFVLPSILAAKHQQKKSSNKDLLHRSAIQSPDRKRLKFLLENSIPFIPFLPDPEAVGQDRDQSNSDLTDNIATIANTSVTEKEKEEGHTNTSTIEKEVDKIEEPKSVPAPVKNKRRDVLKDLEENLNRLKSTSQEDTSEPTGGSSASHDEQSSAPDLELRPEALMDSIKNREKKDVLDAKKHIQDELIDEFNKKTVKFKIDPNIEEIGEGLDLSIESTRLKENLISESFAKILIKQKKIDEAKEIYKKLQLKFPDKKAYFADCLKQLENN